MQKAPEGYPIEITKALLVDYFAGRLNVRQQAMIEEWTLDTCNEKLFYDCLHEWEMNNLVYKAEVGEAIEKFRYRL